MASIAWEHFPWTTYRDEQKVEVESGLTPGRIVSQEGPLFETVTPGTTVRAELSGRLRYLVELGSADFPAVGDYVLLQGNGSPLIDRVLPRQSVFRRREAGDLTQAQVICANVDTAAVMTTAPAATAGPGSPGEEDNPEGARMRRDAIAALSDFSVRRIERYLATLDA